MPVYEGVLEQVSGGSEVAPHGRSETITDSGRVVRHGVDRRIRREFIEIGGKHVPNVVLRPYHDQLLVDSVGEEVALSTFGRRGTKQVIAIRTRRGLSRPHFFRVLAEMVWSVILTCVFAFIVASFFLGAAALFSSGEDLLFWVGNVVVILLLVWPFVRYVRVFRAWGALSSRPPTHPSPLTSIAADTGTIQPSVHAAPASSSAPESASAPPTKRFCGNCGAERSPGGRFCTSCGHA